MNSTLIESAAAFATYGVAEPMVRCVAGRKAVLEMGGWLAGFSARCGQPGAMHDLAYFLSKPGALPRVPHLLLVSKAGFAGEGLPGMDELLGFVLIFDHTISRRSVGAYATNDRSGRSTLVAMPEHRAKVAAVASRALLDRGAHMILMSFRAPEMTGQDRSGPTLAELDVKGKRAGRWALRTRTIPGYLPLAATYDATLATTGQKTRRNLRYYRRRAEAELGCVFVPEVRITRRELLRFNGECMYAPSARVAGLRFDLLKELGEPVLVGIKDGSQRWLSLLGGRRYHGRSEILWQMNRAGLGPHSLATVMRSYFIEHEIAQGSQRLYIEGGTPHTIKHSFVPEELVDLVVMRRTARAKMMQVAGRRLINRDNELSHMLGARDLVWRPC